MVTDIRLRKPLWTAFMALMVTMAAMAPDSRAQGGTTGVSKAITAEFALLPSGVSVPPSFQIAGMTFFAHSSPAGNPIIVDLGTQSERGYGFRNEGVTVVLPVEARAVEVRLCRFAPTGILVEAYSLTGTLVTQERARPGCDNLSLEGGNSDLISIVRFTGGDNEASIVRLSAILNSALVVNTGADQSVAAGALVILSGTADGTIASYAWEQTGGTSVSLSGADGAVAMFTAPDVSADETLTFRLTVTNDDGETASDEVRVVVQAAGGHGVDRYAAVSAGYAHTCALRDTGEVECWGRDIEGQSRPPAGTFTSVSAGWYHTCALRDAGEVECWGSDWGGCGHAVHAHVCLGQFRGKTHLRGSRHGRCGMLG